MGRAVIIDDIIAILKEQAREMHVTEITHLMGTDNRNAISNSLNYRMETLLSDEMDVERVRRGVWRYKEPKVQHVGPASPRQRDGRGSVQVTEVKPVLPDMLEVLGLSSEFELIARDPDTGKIYKASLM